MIKRPLRAYVDTSVFGGVHDVEFAEPSKLFFEKVRAGEVVILVSEALNDELKKAPEKVLAVLAQFGQEFVEMVPLTEIVRELANAYLKAGAVPPKSRFDAMHVAAATVARADLIVSWNFKHIVNFNRIRAFNAVNLMEGFGQIEIRSPSEVIYD